MKVKKFNLFIYLIILVLVYNCATPRFVFAQSSADELFWGGFETNIQEATGLGNEDPRQMAAQLINILLGFLGIIAVLIIILGGFKWMMSAGDEVRADSAKKMLGGGILGLVIILGAFGVAQFVIGSLFEATGATG